jgi:serine/threonine protein kinase
LRDRIAADGGGDAIGQVDRQLEAAAEFLAPTGLVHFDLHFDNVLTDGERLCLADLGLASHDGFDLDGPERAFLGRHAASAADPGYDRAYVRGHFVRWLVTELLGLRGSAVDEAVAAAAAGREIGLPPAAAAVVARDAPLAVVMNDFFRALRTRVRTSPYPAETLRGVYRTV